MVKNFKLSYLIITIPLLGIVALLLWSANKGIDITDESFYLMGYRYPHEVKFLFSNYQLLILKLFNVNYLGLVEIRLIRLLLTFTGTLILSIGFMTWLNSVLVKFNKSKQGLYLPIVFFTIMALSSYSFGPQTLSYNTTSLILIEILIGLFLYNYSKIDELSTYTVIITNTNFVLLGVVFAMLFFVKFSNAIVLLPILAFIYLYKLFISTHYIAALRKVFVKLLFLCTGVFLFTFFYFDSLHSTLLFLNEYAFSLKQLTNKVYDINTLLINYSDSFIFLFTKHIINYKLIIILLATLPILSLNSKLHLYLKHLFIIIYVCGTLSLTAHLYNLDSLNGGTFNSSLLTLPYLIFLVFISIPSLIFVIIKKTRNRQLIIEVLSIGFLFFFLPFIGALGTYNNIMVQIIFYLVFWAMLILCMLSVISVQIKSSIPLFITILCVSFIVFNQIYTAIIYYPYRINGTLLNQNKPIVLNNGATVFYIDSSLYNVVATLKKDLVLNTTYSTNTPVFSYFNHIGITYLINGITPSCAWYTANSPQVKNSSIFEQSKINNQNEMYSTLNCSILAKTDLQLKNKMLLLLNNKQGISANFVKYLKSIDVNFPSDFKLLNNYQYVINKDTSTIQMFVPTALLKH